MNNHKSSWCTTTVLRENAKHRSGSTTNRKANCFRKRCTGKCSRNGKANRGSCKAKYRSGKPTTIHQERLRKHVQCYATVRRQTLESRSNTASRSDKSRYSGQRLHDAQASLKEANDKMAAAESRFFF